MESKSSLCRGAGLMRLFILSLIFFFLLCFNKAAYIWVVGRWMRLLSLAFPFGRLSLENATHTPQPPTKVYVPCDRRFCTI